MKVKDLMATDLFKRCKMLTNEIGLGNNVEAAMVLEAIDIENWGEKNQLILTSFYAFTNVSKNESLDFFKQMKYMGVSGLIVKMDRLITVIPEWLVALCFEYEIPLIKAPEEISYEEIMLTIYEPIINQQEHLLRTYYDVRQKFTKVERNLRSFDQIMETFYSLIDLPCALKIEELDVDLHYEKNYDHFKTVHHNFLETTEFTKNNYERLILKDPNSEEKIVALKTEVMTSFFGKCLIMVYHEEQTIKQSHLIIIENAIDLIHEQLQMVFMLKKDRYTRMNNLADAILQNTPQNSDELVSLLAEANLNSLDYYQGITFTYTENERPLNEKMIIRKLRQLRPLEIYFDHLNYTVILFNLESKADIVTKKEIKKLFANEPSISKQYIFSLSQLKKKHEIKEILLECLDTIRFNQTFFIDYVISIKDLGVLRFFVQEDRFKQIIEIVPNELIHLQQNNQGLFNTLNAFFQNNRSYKKTAESLLLDPKTIRYRLHKVEDLLAIDLANPIQLVNYEIGAYLLSMEKNAFNGQDN